MQDQAQHLRDIVLKARLERAGARTIAVTSGKGGVGKSTVCVNLAISLHRRGFRVLIVDADFGLANVDVMMGVGSPYNLNDVLKGRSTLPEIIQESPCGVKLISGGSGLYELLSLSEVQLHGILNSLLQLEDIADIIIFDTGAGVSDNILRLVNSSTETIIVTTPEPTAIMDAYAMIKTIRMFKDKPPIRIIVNMAASYQEALDTMSSFAKVVGKYLHIDLDPLGYVLNDPVVARSIRTQIPFTLGFPNSTAARNIGAIADRYAEQPFKKDRRAGIAGFLQRLLFLDKDN